MDKPERNAEHRSHQAFRGHDEEFGVYTLYDEKPPKILSRGVNFICIFRSFWLLN